MVTPVAVEYGKLFLDNILVIAGTTFSVGFMLVLAGFLIKALTKLDLTQLFKDPTSGTISPSRFWNTIAFFVATIAFLAMNFAAPGSAGLEVVWMIYLGVVASSSVLTNFISNRWGGPASKSE